MDRRHALKVLTGMALCPICAPSGFAAEGAHWSYEGPTGPSHWGDIDAASKVCSVGAQQSPIDIQSSVKSQLPPLQIAWRNKSDMIVNNGHTIQINADPGNMLTVGASKYELLQFHFHHPSEHLIAGKTYPMEVHFVHKDSAGNLAVIGVMMTAGQANPAFKAIAAAMPGSAGKPVKMAAVDMNQMLPARRGYFRYAGSLTTPPCNEIVNWLVLREPIQVARADIDAFAKLFPMNARPAQKDHRRFILSS